MTSVHPPIPLDPKDVALRAFVLWQRRGCPCGEDLTDWFEAEAELQREALEAPDRPEWPDEDEVTSSQGAAAF
jgi:DUF2934 family protein